MHVRFGLASGSSILLLICGIATPSLRSQALVSDSDWRTVLKDVSKSSHDIKSIKAQLRDVNERGEQLAREEEQLDSQSCASSGSPHQDCSMYNSEEQTLEQSKQALLAEWQGDEERLRSIEDNVTHQMARIRLSKVLAGHEGWTQSVKKCAALPPVDAVQCLDTVKSDQS